MITGALRLMETRHLQRSRVVMTLDSTLDKFAPQFAALALDLIEPGR